MMNRCVMKHVLTCTISNMLFQCDISMNNPLSDYGNNSDDVQCSIYNNLPMYVHMYIRTYRELCCLNIAQLHEASGPHP